MKSCWTPIAAIIFIALILVSCASPAQKKMQEGDVYFGKQDWDKAVVSYSLAAELDPQLKPSKQIAAAYAAKAKQSFDAGDFESAVFNYDKAVSFYPSTKAVFDLGYARYRTGLIYMDKGQNNEALLALGGAIKDGYQKSEAYLARAHVYNLLGTYTGAIGDATACLELDPLSAAAYLERGRAYLATTEYRKALSDLSRAVELGPSLQGAYYYRGMAWKVTGEFKSAIYDFSRAVEQDPASTAALVQLGRSYYLATDYYAAIAQFTLAIELNGKDVAIAFNDRAVCLGRIGQFNTAVTDLKLLVQMKPAFPLAYYNLGVVYMKMVQPPMGIENLDTYMCLDPMDKFDLHGLASGWRWHNIEYNLCCSSRGMSADVLDRCNRLLMENRGRDTVPYEQDALYFGTDQDRNY